MFRELDINGQLTENEYDTYLKCKSKVTIFRYNSDTLAILFPSRTYKNNKINELSGVGIHLIKFCSGEDESVYLFNEYDLPKVAEILKPITKGANKSPTSCAKKKKREMSEEQREVLRQRMILIRAKSQK